MTTTRRTLLALPLLGVLAACGGGATPSTSASAADPPRDATGRASDTTDSAREEQVTMTVYKDPSCGCCGGWVEHAEEHDFAVTTEVTDDLDAVWSRHDIPAALQSCHLARTSRGDLFVGHVPARHMREYIANPPKGARGLSVPAMPVGTPGMERGDRFDPYEVMLIADGDPQVFAKVSSPADHKSPASA
ncbi:hypothetical protein DUHN55_39010 [Helicobacter pylori]